VDSDLPPRRLLLQAFIAIGSRWDGDLDFNLAHPIRGKFLIAHARRIGAGYPALQPTIPPNLRRIETVPAPSPAPRFIDQKSRAAGERDDD
jgi:hypothetical protein